MRTLKASELALKARDKGEILVGTDGYQHRKIVGIRKVNGHIRKWLLLMLLLFDC